MTLVALQREGEVEISVQDTGRGMSEGGIYHAFTLYALGRDSKVERVDVRWPLDEADITVFERMMETLRFRIEPRG